MKDIDLFKIIRNINLINFKINKKSKKTLFFIKLNHNIL